MPQSCTVNALFAPLAHTIREFASRTVGKTAMLPEADFREHRGSCLDRPLLLGPPVLVALAVASRLRRGAVADRGGGTVAARADGGRRGGRGAFGDGGLGWRGLDLRVQVRH